MISLFRQDICEKKYLTRTEQNFIPFKAQINNKNRHYFFSSGRSALSSFFTNIERPDEKVILMPCYVAEGVIKPFVLNKAKIIFYRLNNKLEPNLNDISLALRDKSKECVLILISYFGHIQKSEKLNKLIEKYNPIVIYDLAHAMLTRINKLPLYKKNVNFLLSYNKFLPVVDGASLFLRDKRIQSPNVVNKILNHKATLAYKEHLKIGTKINKEDGYKKIKLYLKEHTRKYKIYYKYLNSDFSSIKPHPKSLSLITHFNYEKMIKARIDNAKIVYSKLNSRYFKPLYKNIEENGVPWCIPVIVEEKNIKIIQGELLKKGIILSSLKDKWNFIPKEKMHYYAQETYFYNNHLLVPINEFIKKSDIKKMINTINNIRL